MGEKPYRGKRTDNGEWVKGYYVHMCYSSGHESHRIYTGCEVKCGFSGIPGWFEVDPATVGRYTGYTDDYETPIFEGDKLSTQSYFFSQAKKIGVVVFKEGTWMIAYGDHNLILSGCLQNVWDCKIVGNIHDDPPKEPRIPASLSEHIMSRFERRQ